ncbi:MAG: hypothetical protein JWP89_6894 [Schlesneria sp.]|nr:hypothetical protein [Schlesneria sp.]
MNSFRYTAIHVQTTTDKGFDEVTSAFEAQLNPWEPDVLDVLASDGDIKAVSTRMEAMVGPSGFLLFTRIDHGALLRVAGMTRKSVQYVVGNPLFALQMTRHDVRAALYAPLRVLIYEDATGKTCVEYDTPSSQFGQFGNENIDTTATMLDEKMAAMVTAAIG